MGDTFSILSYTAGWSSSIRAFLRTNPASSISTRRRKPCPVISLICPKKYIKRNICTPGTRTITSSLQLTPFPIRTLPVCYSGGSSTFKGNYRADLIEWLLPLPSPAQHANEVFLLLTKEGCGHCSNPFS